LNNKCSECNTTLTQNSFERVCPNCGLVDSIIFHDSLAVTGKAPFDINHSICKSYQYASIGNTLINQFNLGTVINLDYRGFRDINGCKIPLHNSRYFNRINKCKNMYMGIDNSNRKRLQTILERVCRYLSLSRSIRSDIAYMFKKITKNEKVSNKVICLSFCVYYIIREKHGYLGITIHDIANAFKQFGHHTSPKLIVKRWFEFKKYIKQITPIGLKQYIERDIMAICKNSTIKDRLRDKGFNESIEVYKKELLEISDKIMNIVIKSGNGRRPTSLSSSIIYTADILIARKNKHKRILTQKILGKYLNISDFTIRDCYNNFLKPLIVNRLKCPKRRNPE